MKTENMSLQELIYDVVCTLPQKIYDVVSNTWGVILSSLVFCGTFLGDRLPLLVYITAAVLVDAIWGITTSKRAKKFIFSKLIAKSAIKMAAYISIYALVALIEKGFADGFILSSSVIAAILISSELWSILGHIGIAYPDFIVVKLLKKYLKGEMSKKLGIPEEELDELLNKKKNDTNSIN